MENIKYYPFFGNLANPLKIRIVGLLKEKEMSVLGLARLLNEEQSKVSHALKSLKDCAIVQMSKKGKQRIYHLNRETILPILEILDKHENKYCKKCLARR